MSDDAIITEDVMKTLHGVFWDGFDSCLEMVFNSLNDYDDKALFSVHKFITEFKDHLEYEAELYKKDG